MIDDAQYEKLSIILGPTAGIYGDFTSPQLIYGDSSGMQIKVAADRYALVRGHTWWSGGSIFTKAIASNSSGSTRVDLVVLRLSRTTWDVTVEIVQGTPGAGPPSSTKNLGTTGVYEMVLATVSVANGAATISAANVTYLATHIDYFGQVRVPTTGALSYVPQALAGLDVTVADANNSRYLYDGSSFVLKPFLGNLGVRQTFTPTLTASTTNPTMGTGSLRVGWYTYLPGPMVNYNFEVLFGSSGAAAGSGTYAISLPVPVASLGSGIVAVGICQLADSSAGLFQPSSCFVVSSGTTLGVVGAHPVINNDPWTWANGDYISGSITYPV